MLVLHKCCGSVWVFVVVSVVSLISLSFYLPSWIWLPSMALTSLAPLFQRALRLLAFGQLYKVLNMDPLPACKPSPRLLEGVWPVTCVSSVPICDGTADGGVFALCRQLSEEVSGGCEVRRQRLYQKDERWLWPLTLLFQRITAGSDNLNPPSYCWTAAL